MFFVLCGLVSHNLFAVGYNCPTKIQYIACAENWFLSNKKCVKCPDNSTTAADNSSTSCTCKDGFSLNGLSTGVKTTSTAACKAYDKAAEEKAKQFTVTYSCGDGSGTKPSNGTATKDTNFTPASNTCTAPAGYSFAGWTVSGAGDVKTAGSAFKWTYTENKTFTAKWSAGSYTITYNMNGGTNSGSNPAAYSVTTATINLATPTRDNSTFGGWYSDSGYNTKVTQIAKGSTGNKTLYAKWTCNAGYSSDSGNTSCVKNPEPETVVTPEPVQNTVEVVKVLPKIEVSKAEMIAVGFTGNPCWMSSDSPIQYKECVRSVIVNRLPN